jgi:hypothetical protein
LQGLAIGLAALVVEMLRVQADLSFQQIGYECLLLFSAGIDIQDYSSCLKGIYLQFYDTGKLLTEDYICEGWEVTEVQL